MLKSVDFWQSMNGYALGPGVSFKKSFTFLKTLKIYFKLKYHSRVVNRTVRLKTHEQGS